MLSSLLSIGYLMPVLVNAWFKREEHHDHGHGHDDHHDHGEASALMVVPLCFTAAGCVALFFGADGLYRLLLPLTGGAL